jgi:hypothetical protein
MPKVLIEENDLKIDEEDMTALVSIFAEHGVDALPVEQETTLKSAWWVLLVHVAEQNVTAYVESIPLQIIGAKVVKHFKNRNRQPPRRIDLTGNSGVASTGDLEYE